MTGGGTEVRAGRWLQCYQPRPEAALRLFCFPYAGGGASVFRTWADGLPPGIEVHAVQLPGREGRLREPLRDRLDLLIQGLLPELEPLLDRPFAFYGHSMGSLVAFEALRALRRRGAPSPAHLFAAARRAPHLPDGRSSVHGLPDAAFLAEVQRYGGLPAAVLAEPELLQLVLPILRADFAVFETYQHAPEPALDVPLAIFVGEADPLVDAAEALAWREVTAGPTAVRTFPGGHFFLQTDRPQVLAAIAERLAPWIGRAAFA